MTIKKKECRCPSNKKWEKMVKARAKVTDKLTSTN